MNTTETKITTMFAITIALEIHSSSFVAESCPSIPLNIAQICKEKYQRSSSIIIGTFIAQTVKIPKNPTLPLSNESEPKTDVYASPRLVPIIGINEPETALTPLKATASAEEARLPLADKNPIYTVATVARETVTPFSDCKLGC